MQGSSEKILTTHVGSLPRPSELAEILIAQLKGINYDTQLLENYIKQAVSNIVEKQVGAEIDIINDGEMGKASYTFYVKDRLKGINDRGKKIGANTASPPNRDEIDHPEALKRRIRPGDIFNTGAALPACDGPISYENKQALRKDIQTFNAVFKTSSAVGGFMNAASPGVLTKFVPDFYYKNEDLYIEALGDAMRVEYETIHAAGLILQIDCPDLASARHNQYQELTEKEFLKIVQRNIAILNHATANIPAKDMRMHICWGNYEGPHTYDVPLSVIFDACMTARPAGFSFEGANPRHAHEWEEIKYKKIPDEKILIPGVIDSTTNFVEHPKLVAQRICNYTNIVGRDRVIASTDCGFATFVQQQNNVVNSVVWEKLKTLSQGAAIASDKLWS